MLFLPFPCFLLRGKKGKEGNAGMHEKFCSHCGTALTPQARGGRERPTCPACGQTVFGKFSIGVGGLLLNEGRALVVQRGENPGQGRWTLPGGYVEEDETPDEAVAREFMEEVGLTVRVTELLSVRNSIREADQNAYYVFRVELTGPLEVVIDGHETVRAEFVSPAEFDVLGDVAPFTRWIIEHHADGAGLRRVRDEARLVPLTGQRWALYAITD
jgi:ADP-ribose pyrophosphatase YjhB (NUDIX family)